MRDWCMDVPEIVNISINTPYPGTETWITEQRRLQTRDYRLFDIQHAVLPTKLPLATFYRELLHTQRVLYRKHMSWWTAPMLAAVLARNLVRGQTNFVRGIMNYNKVYNSQAGPLRVAIAAAVGDEWSDSESLRALYSCAPRARRPQHRQFHRALRRDDAHGGFHLTEKSALLLFQ